MAAFLYFVGRENIRPFSDNKYFKETGLCGIFEGSRNLSIPTAEGPEGPTGTMLSPGPMLPGEMCYDKEKQEWRPSLCGKYWVGFIKDKKPTPMDLQRKSLVKGEEIAGGWVAPQARLLPCQWIPCEDGTWTEGPEEKYKRLWEISEFVWDGMSDDDKFKQEVSPVLKDLCVEIMAFNYRIGKLEAFLCGLTTDTYACSIVRSLLDIRSLEEVSGDGGKKK